MYFSRFDMTEHGNQIVHKINSYVAYVINLVSLGGLYASPKPWINEKNWRFWYIFFLAFMAFFIIHFLYTLSRSFNEHYEKSLKWALFLIGFSLCVYLIHGIYVLFFRFTLVQIEGSCLVSLQPLGNSIRYSLHLGQSEEYSLSQAQFYEFKKKSQYVVLKRPRSFYECEKEKVTVTFTPHFHQLISIK